MQYTAPVVSTPKPKTKAESEEFERLREIKKNRDSMKKKEKKVEFNQTSNLIHFYD